MRTVCGYWTAGPYGGFGEYVNVKEYQLRKLPDNVTFEQGACIEPLSLALYGLRRGNMQVGDTLLIGGAGPTAVLSLLGAKAAGASKIYMSEVKPVRRNRCAEWGATEVFDPSQVSVAEEIMKRTEYGVDIAIDCSGNNSCMKDCLKSLRKRGTYVQSGLPVGEVTLPMFDFAYSVMPDKQLYKLRKTGTSKKIAVLAEPLACIVNSLNKLKMRAGDYCVVLGDGPVALMYAELLIASGASKVIVSAHSDVRKHAARVLGALVVDPREEDLIKFVRDNTDNLGADIVVDCVGNLIRDAIACCSVGGQVVLFGLDATAEETVNPFEVSHREIQVVGSYVTNDSFSRAVRLIEDGVVRFQGLITHVYDLTEIHRGFEAIWSKKAIKVVINCNGSEIENGKV